MAMLNNQRVYDIYDIMRTVMWETHGNPIFWAQEYHLGIVYTTHLWWCWVSGQSLEKNAAYCFWWYLIQTEDWRHKMQPRKKTWGLPTWLEKPPLFSTYFHWWINRCTLVSFRKKFQFHPKFDNCSGPLGMKNKHPLPGGWATQGKISQVVLLAHYNRTNKIRRTWIRYWYWYCNVVAMTMIMTIIVIIYQYWQITITIVNNI